VCRAATGATTAAIEKAGQKALTEAANTSLKSATRLAAGVGAAVCVVAETASAVSEYVLLAFNLLVPFEMLPTFSRFRVVVSKFFASAMPKTESVDVSLPSGQQRLSCRMLRPPL
jgi:hypothetical protein